MAIGTSASVLDLSLHIRRFNYHSVPLETNAIEVSTYKTKAFRRQNRTSKASLGASRNRVTNYHIIQSPMFNSASTILHTNLKTASFHNRVPSERQETITIPDSSGQRYQLRYTVFPAISVKRETAQVPAAIMTEHRYVRGFIN